MKGKMLTYLKFTGLIGLIAFLFAFTTRRNEERKIHQVKVEFVQEQNPYVNEQAVNKLLIPKSGTGDERGQRNFSFEYCRE